ncbi:22270_t:CDS:1, partial [Gigaspora margarita]
SGIIDFSGNNNSFSNLLSFETKWLLVGHKFSNHVFPVQIKIMIDEFIKSYDDLRIDFDPALM